MRLLGPQGLIRSSALLAAAMVAAQASSGIGQIGSVAASARS